jgi:glycosyltransferase involved in cell wall biosynthesis
MANPKVTVLIDTYNHERFIEQAIESVLVQDFPRSEMEILVVDDGSTDRTPDLVRKFEPQVRLIRKPNGGQASAFNAGIPEARGEFVAFLDGDDWWEPRKLTRVAEAFSADPSLGIVGHGIVMLHRDGSQLTETLREDCNFQANTLAGVRLFRRLGSQLGTSRMTIRADLLRRIGHVPEEIVFQSDEYLYTLACLLAPARILPEALMYYRLHDANLFQFSVPTDDLLRRKKNVMEALRRCLGRELPARGVAPGVAREVLEFIQGWADQLRLMLGDGWPWETARTELTLYDAMHPDASTAQRAFKAMTLVPALVMPPKLFYKIRYRVATSELYLNARKRWLPIPEMAHLKRTRRAAS